MFHDRQDFRSGDTKRDAEQTTDRTERHRLNQELGEDIAAMRTDGHPVDGTFVFAVTSAKDKDALLASGEAINTSCDNCHLKYQRQ